MKSAPTIDVVLDQVPNYRLTTGRKLSGDVEDSPGMDDDDDDIDFASVNENKDGMSKDGNGHGCARTTYVT